jgi:N-acetylglucosaminyldiphosphoundecaprenol N-acetyl-beta-D-mannosaminyltransferase
MDPRIRTISLLDVQIHNVTAVSLITFIENSILSDNHVRITNVNIHAMNIAYQATWFKEFLNTADVNFCDGYGITVAAHLLGLDQLSRLTPPDWVTDLAKMCVNRKFSMYFLGSHPEVVEQAARKLESQTPGLNIVGTHHGYFNKNLRSEENKEVIAKINAQKPNILWIGFGMPLQEHWLMENWNLLDINVAITGGAIFDYISGTITRGPKWMTDYGLEWLARLFIEPGRLWRRYLIGNPLFFWRLFKHQLGF